MHCGIGGETAKTKTYKIFLASMVCHNDGDDFKTNKRDKRRCAPGGFSPQKAKKNE